VAELDATKLVSKLWNGTYGRHVKQPARSHCLNAGFAPWLTDYIAGNQSCPLHQFNAVVMKLADILTTHP